LVQHELPVFDHVQEGMATRNHLMGLRRELSKGQKAIAKLRKVVQRKLWDGELRQSVIRDDEIVTNLYLLADTRPMASSLSRAEMDFFDLFIKPARRDRHLQPGSGRPIFIDGVPLLDEAGEQIWDDGEWAVDESGNYILDGDGKLVLSEIPRDIKGKWRCVHGPLTRSMIKGHINGNTYFGIYGGQHTNHFVIDLDLHSGDPDLFRRRLEHLVPVFHAKFASHYSVSEGGVHIIGVLDKKLALSEVRDTLINVLRKHDSPDLGLLNSGGSPAIELFPDPNRGIRLPLAKDRLVLLDQVLPNKQLRSRRLVPDVMYYMNWINNPKRQYMDFAEVINLVNSTVKPRASSLITSIDHGVSHVPVVACEKARSVSPQKGQFLSNLVKFWSGEIDHEPGLFNKYLVMTSRLLIASELNDDLVKKSLRDLCNSLKERGFASNTLNDEKVLAKHISEKISECRANKNLPDPEQSKRKLKQVAMYCESIGFKIQDPSTWSPINNNKNKPIASIIICDPKFDLTEEDKIRRHLLPILKTDLETAKLALIKLFRWIGGKEKEISSRKLLPKLLGDIEGLSISNHDKQRKFLKWVEAMGWLVKIREYSPKQKARKFALGESMLARMIQNIE